MRSMPLKSIEVAVNTVPSAGFPFLVSVTAKEVSQSTFFEHALLWARAVLSLTNEPLFGHARAMEVAPALRLLHRAIHDHDSFVRRVDDNFHKLQFLAQAARLHQQRRGQDTAAAETTQ